jgi:hypothetical protein
MMKIINNKVNTSNGVKQAMVQITHMENTDREILHFFEKLQK